LKLILNVSPSRMNRSGMIIAGKLDGVVELEEESVEFPSRTIISTNWAEPILLVTDRVQLTGFPLVTDELVAGSRYPRSPIREYTPIAMKGWEALGLRMKNVVALEIVAKDMTRMRNAASLFRVFSFSILNSCSTESPLCEKSSSSGSLDNRDGCENRG